MLGDYYCAHCEDEFVVEEGEGGADRPPCPKCGQTESVQSTDTSALIRAILRQWFVVLAILFLVGAGIVLYQWTNGE